MIEWAWVLRLVEGLKPQTKMKMSNKGGGSLQVGCNSGNITVVNLILPSRHCCGSCKVFAAQAEEMP